MIYLIETEDKEYLKIGYTRSKETLEKRVKLLMCTSPQKINVLNLQEGNFSDEKNLHNKFKSFRSNGEWYNYNEEIIEGFKNYNKEDFVVKKVSKSYKKLKEENKRLKQQLLTIANDPTSDVSQGIIFMYKFQSDLTKCIFIGSPTSQGTGVYEQITKV